MKRALLICNSQTETMRFVRDILIQYCGYVAPNITLVAADHPQPKLRPSAENIDHLLNELTQQRGLTHYFIAYLGGTAGPEYCMADFPTRQLFSYLARVHGNAVGTLMLDLLGSSDARTLSLQFVMRETQPVLQSRQRTESVDALGCHLALFEGRGQLSHVLMEQFVVLCTQKKCPPAYKELVWAVNQNSAHSAGTDQVVSFCSSKNINPAHKINL